MNIRFYRQNHKRLVLAWKTCFLSSASWFSVFSSDLPKKCETIFFKWFFMSAMVSILFVFWFFAKNKKKLVFFCKQKTKKLKNFSAHLFLLKMRQIQILLNKITKNKMLIENEKIPNFGRFSFSKKSLKIGFSLKKLKKFQKKFKNMINFNFLFFCSWIFCKKQKKILLLFETITKTELWTNTVGLLR